VADGHIREQRRWDVFIASARHRQSLVPTHAAIDQRPQQRKVVCEIFEHALEIPLQPSGARACFCVAPIAPLGELLGDYFLNGFPVCEVGRATGAGPDEVVLAKGEARRKIGRFNQSANVRARRWCETEPVPPTLDDLAERADRDSFAIGWESRASFDKTSCRRRAATAQPD
jgi:hypothetical protein